MSKIKLVQSIQVLDSEIKYSDILNDVNQLKSKILLDLKSENLEDEFEIVIDVNNDRESISFK